MSLRECKNTGICFAKEDERPEEEPFTSSSKGEGFTWAEKRYDTVFTIRRKFTPGHLLEKYLQLVDISVFQTQKI